MDTTIKNGDYDDALGLRFGVERVYYGGPFHVSRLKASKACDGVGASADSGIWSQTG